MSFLRCLYNCITDSSLQWCLSATPPHCYTTEPSWSLWGQGVVKILETNSALRSPVQGPQSPVPNDVSLPPRGGCGPASGWPPSPPPVSCLRPVGLHCPGFWREASPPAVFYETCHILTLTFWAKHVISLSPGSLCLNIRDNHTYLAGLFCE